MNLKLRHYMTQDEVRRELMQLRAYRGSYVGDGLFDWFEETGLVRSVLRLAWSEPVARRWWREGHEWAGQMRDPVEPDGERLGIRGAYGDAPHPFDDPEPRWMQFLQLESDQVFVRRDRRRYPVGHDHDPIVFDRGHYAAAIVDVLASVASSLAYPAIGRSRGNGVR